MTTFENRTNYNVISPAGDVNVRIKDTNGKEIESDDLGYLVIIDIAHHKVHEGKHYFVDSYVELDSTGVLDIVFTTPVSPAIGHWKYDIAVTADTLIQIYEGTTHSDDGAGVTVFNSDRNSANTTGITVQTDPTVTVVGTLLEGMLIGSTLTPSRSLGGGSGRETELNLKYAEDYLIRITSNTNGNNIDYNFNWYEV